MFLVVPGKNDFGKGNANNATHVKSLMGLLGIGAIGLNVISIVNISLAGSKKLLARGMLMMFLCFFRIRSKTNVSGKGDVNDVNHATWI